MANPNYAPQGWVARALSIMGLISDGVQSDPRGPRYNGYSELQVGGGSYGGERLLADEGCLFNASMTPGQTALNIGVLGAFDATKATLVIKNNAPAKSGIRLALHEIHFLCAVAPASGTSLLYATAIDNGNRQPTTVSTTPGAATAYKPGVNAVNYSNPPVTILPSVWFPNTTAGGAAPAVPGATDGTVYMVGNGNLRTQIPIGAATSGIQDDYRIVFGAQDRATGAGTRFTANPSQIIEPHAAVSLDPQAYFLLHLWSPSNATTAMAFAGLDVWGSLR